MPPKGQHCKQGFLRIVCQACSVNSSLHTFFLGFWLLESCLPKTSLMVSNRGFRLFYPVSLVVLSEGCSAVVVSGYFFFAAEHLIWKSMELDTWDVFSFLHRVFVTRHPRDYFNSVSGIEMIWCCAKFPVNLEGWGSVPSIHFSFTGGVFWNPKPKHGSFLSPFPWVGMH